MAGKELIALVTAILSLGLGYAYVRPQEEIGYKEISLLVLGGVVGMTTQKTLGE
jgi:hypothetical protein